MNSPKSPHPRRPHRSLLAAAAGLMLLPWALPAAQPAATTVAPGAARAADPAAEIQDLIGRMVAAVAAADQAAYMACVDQSDPVFAQEQQNWAKDLARKPTESYELELAESVALGPDGAARVELTTKWRMPGARHRTLSFPARFVRTDAGWLYAGEWWNVHDGEGTKVFYEDGSLADVAKAVAELLPGIRGHVHEGFELADDKDLVDRIQQVKLYTSVRHLQHSIYLSYVDGLGGWNEPGESIKILASPGTRKGTLRILLGHEYGHVATFQLGPKANDMPWWILEGVAEMAAERYSRGGEMTDRRVELWAKRDGLIDWAKLADFHGEAANHYSHVYTQGHHMIRYISGRFGREGRNGWLRAMAQGATLDEATERALGLRFAQLDEDWRKSLKAAAEEPEDEESKAGRAEPEAAKKDEPSPAGKP